MSLSLAIARRNKNEEKSNANEYERGDFRIFVGLRERSVAIRIIIIRSVKHRHSSDEVAKNDLPA